MRIKPPFPYFGGKSLVASEVWRRFGDVHNYVEPFFGSGAVLLGRPAHHRRHVETVNDLDGMVSNFWRAVKAKPDDVAAFADWPVNENDLHARHAWLVGQKASLQSRLEGDPEFFDAKVAGWWCWGLCCWIGSGFCSGNGPSQGLNRKRVHLGDAGHGVKRQRVHLGRSQGVNRKLEEIAESMHAIAERLRNVRVCCGDWSRVCGPTPMEKHGERIGVFLDPPYSDPDRDALYTEESFDVAKDVRAWALERAADPRYRIALCGYDDEHEMSGWSVHEWKTTGGYGSQSEDGQGRENSHRERIWFSPACNPPTRQAMFVFEAAEDVAE